MMKGDEMIVLFARLLVYWYRLEWREMEVIPIGMLPLGIHHG